MHRGTVGMVLLLLAAALVYAQDRKPNFTGQWRLNRGLSENPPQSEVDSIEHKDPIIIITPRIGRADVVRSVGYRTNGEDLKDKRVTSGKLVSAYWKGSDLVIDTKTPGYGGMNGLKREVMSLSEDGKVMRRDVYDGMGNRPGKRLVFDRICKYSGYLPPNTSEAGVRAQLGEPDRVEKTGEETHLVYKDAEIIFANGRVISSSFCVSREQ